MVVPSQKYTHEDSSSYKIQFYCQNSAHKTLQNDCKKKKKLVDNSSSHNWRFKPHQSANFKGMFPQKIKIQVDVYFTEEQRNMSHRHFFILVLNHILSQSLDPVI